MKRWHWILIGASVVVILGFAVVIYALTTPPPPGYTIYTVARLIFDFLDKWASAGAPAMTLLAVAVALYMGIKSLRQTEKIQKQERKERLLNEIIEWVLDVKLRTLQANTPTITLKGKRRYEVIFLAISDALLKAELMSSRASENSIPIENELNNVWQSAFFCSQLATRMTGNRPTDEQMESWSRNARDIVASIDQLEEQGRLTTKEMLDGQRDLLKKVSLCLKKLAQIEAS